MLRFRSRKIYDIITGHIEKAEQTLDKAVEETKEFGNDTARAVKKAGRDIEDKACEMVNGKLDCATKKIEHAAENAADKAKDLAD